MSISCATKRPTRSTPSNDLRPRYGVDCEFILAIGADAVPDLHRWHRYDQLIEECTFAVVERPGSPLDDKASLPNGTRP